jgi:plastocyanin
MKLNKLMLGLCCAGVLTTAALAEEHVVNQKDRTFSTTEITVKPGDSLTFTNSDDVTHNVFSNSKQNTFNIRVQEPGHASTVQFKDEGVTEVRCAIHPRMKLIVNVKN